MYKLYVMLSVTVLTVFAFTPVALAQDANTPRATEVRTERAQAQIEERTEGANPFNRSEDSTEPAAVDGESAKQAACEMRVEKINDLMERQVLRSERYINLFATTAEKVSQFYEEHELEAEGYEEAHAKIDENHERATELFESIKLGSQEFDCELDDPKDTVENFRHNFRELVQTLKDYRDSVVGLIEVVQTAVDNSNSEDDAIDEGQADETQ